ncbi:MAG: hypothetical protein V1918_00730 [Planctomycetota bacterium]
MPNMEAWGAWLWRRYSPSSWERHIFHTDDRIREACAASGLVLTDIFHFGNPMLQAAPWEKPSAWLKFVGVLQRALNLPGKILPLYDRGTRRISSIRGFAAGTPAAASATESLPRKAGPTPAARPS